MSSVVWNGVPVTHLCWDTRRAQPGCTFFCFHSGRKVAQAVRLAVQAGARAVVVDETCRNLPVDLGASVMLFRVKNARKILSYLAKELFQPCPDTIVATTGTDGKTSTTHMIYQLWRLLGLPSAGLGTLGLTTETDEVEKKVDRKELSLYTTPEPIVLYQTLQQCALGGITHVALEASSQGLDQCRLDHVPLSAAALTQIGRDHLDYHASFEAYLASKLRLFSDILPKDRPGIVFHSMSTAFAAQKFISATSYPITVGPLGLDVTLLRSTPTNTGYQIDIRSRDGRQYTSHLPLLGQFQVYNALTALAAVCLTPPFPALAQVFPLLEKMRPIPGRLERVAPGVYIDYAHTPDALEAALRQLRRLVQGRLIVVFGCGGCRDPGKRPIMGSTAARWADVVIVTDDNPRWEDPASIRSQILSACPGGFEISDRRGAIDAALRAQMPGDILLVAGKGAETAQVIGDQIIPFSDKEAIMASLDRRADNPAS